MFSLFILSFHLFQLNIKRFDKIGGIIQYAYEFNYHK